MWNSIILIQQNVTGVTNVVQTFEGQLLTESRIVWLKSKDFNSITKPKKKVQSQSESIIKYSFEYSLQVVKPLRLTYCTSVQLPSSPAWASQKSLIPVYIFCKSANFVHKSSIHWAQWLAETAIGTSIPLQTAPPFWFPYLLPVTAFFTVTKHM